MKLCGLFPNFYIHMSGSRQCWERISCRSWPSPGMPAATWWERCEEIPGWWRRGIREWQHSCLRNLVAEIIQLWDSPHALLAIDDEPVILQGLCAPRGSCSRWLYIIHAGKGCVAVSDGPVHMPLEGCPCVSEAKRHPLVFKQAEGDCYTAVFCTISGLTGVPLVSLCSTCQREKV